MYSQKESAKAVDELLQAVTLEQTAESAGSDEELKATAEDDATLPGSRSTTEPVALEGTGDNNGTLAGSRSGTDRATDDENAHGSYFTHADPTRAYKDLDNLTEAKRHRQILDSIENSADSEKPTWQERLRRKILRKEVDAKFGNEPEDSDVPRREPARSAPATDEKVESESGQ